MGFFEKLFSGLNSLDKKVTFAIALAGFLMSAISWLRTLWRERMRLDVTVSTFDIYSVAFRGSLYTNITFPLRFQNKSTRGLSIFSVSLEGGGAFPCLLRAGFIGTLRNTIPVLDGDKPYLRYLESAQFPINLSGLQSVREHITFQLPLDYDYTQFSEIVIHTSARRIILDDREQIARVRGLFEKELPPLFQSDPTIRYDPVAPPQSEQ